MAAAVLLHASTSSALAGETCGGNAKEAAHVLATSVGGAAEVASSSGATATTPCSAAATGPASTDPLPAADAVRVAQRRLSNLQSLTTLRDDSTLRELAQRLQRDAAAATASTLNSTEERAIARRAATVDNMLQRSTIPLRALQILADRNHYPANITDASTAAVARVRRMYLAALGTVHTNPTEAERLFARADRAMAALPYRLTGYYLERGKGIETVVSEQWALWHDIRNLRSQNHRRPDTLVDRHLRLYGDRPTSSPFRRRVQGLRRAFSDGEEVSREVHHLYNEAVEARGMMALVAMNEQFHLLRQHLDHIADNNPFVTSQGEVAARYIRSFEDHLSAINNALRQRQIAREGLDEALENLRRAETPANRAAVEVARRNVERIHDVSSRGIREALVAFQRTLQSRAFARDMDNIKDRLQTIQTVNLVARVVAIVVVAAFMAHAAGLAAGAILEGAGASTAVAGTGAFAAEVVVFTAASRAGNEALLGGNQTSFGEDLVQNALMFGALRGTAAIYGRTFRAFKDSHRVAYQVGRLTTGMLTLQGFTELHHRFSQGRFMNDEERYRSVIMNSAVFTGLEVGRFLASPLETRLRSAIGRVTEPMFRARLAELSTARTALTEELSRAARNPDEAEFRNVLERLERLWNQEILLLRNAVRRGWINESQYRNAIQIYDNQLASLELSLARQGIDVSCGAGCGERAFRPVSPGTVVFNDARLPLLQEFFRSHEGTLRALPNGLYEGRIGDDTTIFVPESRTRLLRTLDQRLDALRSNTRVNDPDALLRRAREASNNTKKSLRNVIEQIEEALEHGDGPVDVARWRDQLLRALEPRERAVLVQTFSPSEYEAQSPSAEQTRADLQSVKQRLQGLLDTGVTGETATQIRDLMQRIDRGEVPDVWRISGEIYDILGRVSHMALPRGSGPDLRRNFFEGLNTEELQSQRTGHVRTDMGLARPQVRPIGVVEYQIGDESGRAAASSMDADSPGYPRGFIGNAERALLEPTPTGEGNPRHHDAEYKLLNWLANRFSHLRGKATGRVRLYVEMEPCPSCTRAIEQFRAFMGEGVQVEIVWGNGT